MKFFFKHVKGCYLENAANRVCSLQTHSTLHPNSLSRTSHYCYSSSIIQKGNLMRSNDIVLRKVKLEPHSLNYRWLNFLPIAILLSLFGIKEVLCEENKAVIKLKAYKEDGDKIISAYSEKNKLNKPNPKIATKGNEDVDKHLNVEKEDVSKARKEEPADLPSLPPVPNKKSSTDSTKAPTYAPNELLKEKNVTLKSAIEKSRVFIQRKMAETGSPGMVVAVSINGRNVWMGGFGYADVENQVQCNPYTIMRIASISKSITMAAVGKLVEEGKLDLDAPIQKYVPNFPIKIVSGKEVTITTRHLLSHTSGIRHYKLKGEEENKIKEAKKVCTTKNPSQDITPAAKVKERKEELRQLLADKIIVEREKNEKEETEFDLNEYYIKETFDTTDDALELFKDDDLFFKPGEKYLYTTHGFTLVAAVLEGVTGKSFQKLMTSTINELGMENTYFDKEKPIIYYRSRYYERDGHGRLKNAPFVNNSYKWAGGGFLSNVADLNRFGNAMLYSAQYKKDAYPARQPGFLTPETMRLMWSPSPNAKSSNESDFSYGLGWEVVESNGSTPYCRIHRNCVAHTGGAIGASSILLILPESSGPEETHPDGVECISLDSLDERKQPHGVVVSIMTNLTGVGLRDTAINIASAFVNVKFGEKVVGQIAGKPETKVFTLSSL